MKKLTAFLHKRAEDVLVTMMGAMFVAFIMQVALRYLLKHFNFNAIWTEEVILFSWIWGILWGAAFVNSNHEDIRFDMIYNLLSAQWQRWFTFFSSAAFVMLFVWALPATFKYVTFMKVESSNAMGIRLDYYFSIYIAFMVMMIVRHGYIAYRALINKNDGFSPDINQTTTS
jgi:C4-dicarboxylate transporter, DctQ subunit